MEVLYLLSLLVVCVSISLSFLNRYYSQNTSKLPPGSTGCPIIGEALHFTLSGPEKFIHERMKKYCNEIFTTSLLGEKTVVVCGAAGNKFLFYAPNHRVTRWIPAAILKLLYRLDSVKQGSTKFRKILNEILRPEASKHYIPIMDLMAREHLKTDWAPFEEVKIFPLSQKYSLSLACRLVLGLEDPKQVQEIADSFNLAMSGMFSVPINFPGTSYNRGLNEGKRFKQELLKIIRERKKMVSLSEYKDKDGLDILSRLLLDGNDHFRSDLEISNNLISLLLPSYESTSATITFVLKYLAELPHIYDEVHKELSTIAKSKGPGEMLNWEDIQKMKYSWNVICETMRLVPPSLGTFREAKTELNFAGFTIPKGQKILWSPFTTNKNPKYFPDPETFDPLRYEGDRQTPCTFVPFGGGPRMCPGKEYSKFLILVFIYNVVTKFKLQALIQDEKIIYRAGPVPANGLPISLKSHHK